jgi:pyruvate dehydrogenase E2 component (dihydrolipoyllysine-residue acetyltransferase)
MPVEIRLPQLADDMSVAKVGAWLKHEGDPVRAGEPIVEIETDKTNVEVESPASGYLQRIVVPAGSDDVAVNTVLALIADEHADIATASPSAASISAFAFDPERISNRASERPLDSDPEGTLGLELEKTLRQELEGTLNRESEKALTQEPERTQAPERTQNPEPPSTLNPAPLTPNPEPHASLITPLAREIARLNRLDLSTVHPASGGRITRHDVERALGHNGPSASTVLQSVPAVSAVPAPLAPPEQPWLPAAPVRREPAAPHAPFAAREPLAALESAEAFEPASVQSPPEHAAAPEPTAPPTLPEPAGSASALPHEDAGATVSFDLQPLTNVRRVTATRLQQAKQTVPHFYLEVECQVDALIELRAKWNARHAEAKLTVNDFVVFAVSRALVQVPQANAAWAETAVRVYRSVDVAVAVNTAKGLLTPVVRGCQQKSLVAISREIAALAERARAGHLRPDEYSGATFTVSNLGMFGVSSITPIVNPPAACILGVGTIEERPVVAEGRVVPGHTMRCTLAADHRAVDGATGAELMAALRRRLEDPLALMLEG